MQIPQHLPQFEDEKSFLIVSAKERGIVYSAFAGELERLEDVAEHPPTYSDNEGFFFGGGRGGNRAIGGAPKEIDKEHNLRQYLIAISREINALLRQEKPDCLYVFEPVYLAGKLVDHVKNPTHIPVHLVRTGNFIHEDPLVLLEYVYHYLNGIPDPSDPASVGDEPDAKEKRKILSVGR